MTVIIWLATISQSVDSRNLDTYKNQAGITKAIADKGADYGLWYFFI